MIKISIILAVYNEEKYLQKCLNSLLLQVGVGEVEIIIIDDGSKEKSLLKDFGEKSHLHLFRIKHSGTAIARNYGASKAKGEILVFVDGDMRFEKDFLKKLTKPISNGMCKGTFSSEEFVGNWDNIWARCWNYENGLPGHRRINLQRKDMVKDFRAILKTEFIRVKGFDDIGYTDTWTLSQKLHYLPCETKALYYHYNPSSLKEVLTQSIWIGKRQRKYGNIGKLVSLIRSFFLASLVKGLICSIRFNQPHFFLFQPVYDLGISLGIMQSMYSNRYDK